MKKFKALFFVSFLLVFAFLSIAAISTDAVNGRRTLDNGWKVITVAGLVVPGDTVLNSQVFSLPRDRDVATATYPMCAYVDLDSATYGTNGDVAYLITIQGAVSTAGTFSNVDTLYNDTDADSTVTDDTWTLNPNLYPKYPYYRIRIAATGVQVATPDTNAFTIKLW